MQEQLPACVATLSQHLF